MASLIQMALECPHCQRPFSVHQPARGNPEGVRAEQLYTCHCGYELTVTVSVTKKQVTQPPK